MDFLKGIYEDIESAVSNLYDVDLSRDSIVLSPTKKDFKGDYTMVVFPLVKQLRKAPPVIADEIGKHLKSSSDFIEDYNVIQGFLNLSLSNDYWSGVVSDLSQSSDYGVWPRNGKKVLVEFSSPNTNKPLHLGHIRNILLGWSCSEILNAAGYDVTRTQIINDRGIAVCKSMLAWLKFGNNETPATKKEKGDHFVGNFYVAFESHFKQEYAKWQKSDEGQKVYRENGKDVDEEQFFKSYKNEYFNSFSELGKEAKEMLLKWEDNDPEVRGLWNKMNGWVYEGFNETYEHLGVSFDKLYYESDTYLLGKEIIEQGLQSEVFYKEPDGSVWVDLEDVGMDKKILLRSDGTAVYMTQDLGTAQVRYKETGAEKMVYTVADEQDYHFKVLFEILKRLGEPYAAGLHHLSYGMVDLPSGKMKSREGTVVDADELMKEVISEARNSAAERGEIHELDESEQMELLRKIGLAALKFFIIKVSPQKRMIFNPQESVDMQGQTGPYIQNAYVRIRSVLRKFDGSLPSDFGKYTELLDIEKDLVKQLIEYPALVTEAAEAYDPSSVANFSYALAKNYHRFYHEARILTAESEDAKNFRILLSDQVSKILGKSMKLLGIEMPEKM